MTTTELAEKLRTAIAEIRRLRTVCVAQAAEIARLRELERGLRALAEDKAADLRTRLREAGDRRDREECDRLERLLELERSLAAEKAEAR